MSSVYNLFYEPSTGEVRYGTFGIQGPQGLGQQGIIGADGTAFRGVQGLQGTTTGTAQGFQGPQGFQGFQGFLGFQGLQGFQGFQGHNVRGFQGFQGRQGFQGFRGTAGLNGLVGTAGVQGSIGVFPVQQEPVAIGSFAGSTTQGLFSTAVGADAGKTNQGTYALAVGYQAGLVSQAPNSIILNALGTPLNSGTTGFFVNPIRFTSVPPIPAGIQGNRGVQGFQGFQGLQGFQGFQGTQGGVGLQGAASGSLGQIQYNLGGAFRASNNLVYSATTNNFNFGTGLTGGRFNVTGGLAQGTVANGTASGGAKIANVLDGVRNFEMYSTLLANNSLLSFKSNDASSGVLFDSAIQSLGGVNGTPGGGTLEFANLNAPRYAFTGSSSMFRVGGNIQFMAGNDRTVGNVADIITTGSLAGGFSNIRIFFGYTGGLFNIMANEPSGAFAFRKLWIFKDTSSSFAFLNVGASAENASAGCSFSITNDPLVPGGGDTRAGISIYMTNTVSPQRTIYYTIVQTMRNPFYGN